MRAGSREQSGGRGCGQFLNGEGKIPSGITQPGHCRCAGFLRLAQKRRIAPFLEGAGTGGHGFMRVG